MYCADALKDEDDSRVARIRKMIGEGILHLHFDVEDDGRPDIVGLELQSL